MAETFADVGDCVDAVLRRVGPRVVLTLPLGIGNRRATGSRWDLSPDLRCDRCVVSAAAARPSGRARASRRP